MFSRIFLFLFCLAVMPIAHADQEFSNYKKFIDKALEYKFYPNNKLDNEIENKVFGVIPKSCTTEYHNPIRMAANAPHIVGGNYAPVFHTWTGIQFDFSYTNKPDWVTVVLDTCTGVRLYPPSGNCDRYWQRAPEEAGLYEYDLNLTVTYWGIDPNTNQEIIIPGSCATAKTRYLVVDEETAPECPANQPGSIIRAENQSVSEAIELIGTNFDLYYSSEYAAEYVNSFKATRSNFFAPEMLNISVQHYYDPTTTRVYYGTGSSKFVEISEVGGGNFQTVSSDGSEVYTFSATGKHLNTRYALTGATKYTFNYDINNKLESIVDAFGNTTEILRDGSGVLIGIEAPFGQVTNISINVNGLVESITNPNSEEYEFTYKSGTELLETFSKPDGQLNTFTYNANGKLTKDASNSGSEWLLSVTNITGGRRTIMTTKEGYDYTYETSVGPNFMRTETAPSGVKTYFTENGISDGYKVSNDIQSITTINTIDERLGNSFKRPASRVLRMASVDRTTTYSQVLDPVTPVDMFTFDSITNTETRGASTHTSVYDSLTKTHTNTSDEGVISYVTINSQEQVVSEQVGTDKAWTTEYDVSGRVEAVEQDDKKRVEYTYNVDGYLQKETNARNEETSYLYDLAGRVTQVTLPDLRVISYEYDSNGNVTGITPPSRPKHSFVFNLMEKLEEYLPPSLVGLINKDTAYEYDLDKKLTKITRPDGLVADYIYSPTTGNLTEIDMGANSFEFTYDFADRVNQKHSPDGYYNRYTFYGNNIRNSIIRANGSNTNLQRIDFNYDSNHRRSSSLVTGTAAGTTINYAYNGDDMPVTVGAMSLSYDYPSGRLETLDLDNITVTYGYDNYGDLITYTAEYVPTSTVLYTYTLTRDIMGRISGKSETVGGITSAFVYSYDDAGRLIAVTKNGSPYSSYTYDDNSNRTSGTHAGTAFTATYDNQDRMLTYNTKNYEYNANGELTKIELSPTDEMTFTYDALGNLKSTTLPTSDTINYGLDGEMRRMERILNGSTVVNRYVYDGQFKIAAELNASRNILKEYVGVTSVNTPDYMIQSGSRYMFIKDHLGSPRLVVNTSTGVISQAIEYTEFGKVISDTNPGFQPYGFAGGISDQDTGLLKFVARDYDPETGRWTSKDPIRFNGGDANLYGYVLNDPVNLVDSNGLSWLEFDRSSGTLLLYPGIEGETFGPPEGFSAANNASSTSGGVWPYGQFNYEKYNPHTGADSDSSYGPNGNFMFEVPGRTDMGVHSGRANKCDKAGRCGVEHATLGCIRTTDDATSRIKRKHNGGDPLTHLRMR